MAGDTDRRGARAVASWYTSGVSDGLGDRLLMFDNTAAASLELLRFRPELAAVDGFERALRESVRQLEHFRHPAFAHARRVERLDDDRLALVSTHVAGKRLSEIFARPQPQRGMHPGFAAWLIGQLTPALAALHAQGDGVAHGVLTSDRIVLTQDGQFVIVEYVLGASIGRLRLTADRLWRELAIAAAQTGGLPAIDAKGDIVQLALIAVSSVLGRRVTPEEYPERLTPLLDEFDATAARRSPLLAPPLRQWLERALRGGGKGFESAREAIDGLRDLRALPGNLFEEFRPAALASVSPSPSPTPDAPDPASPAADSKPHLDEWIDDPLRPEDWEIKEDAGDQDREEMDDLIDAEPPGRPLALRIGGIALALLAGLQALVIAWLLMRPSGPTAGSVPVTIESAGLGEAVAVNGRQVGRTPFRLNIDASVQVIRLPSPERPAVSDPPRPPAPGVARLGQTDEEIALAAARPQPGGVRLSSPIDLQILLGDRVLGSSSGGPVFTSAGRHELNLVNSQLGYRGKRTVEIEAGRIIALAVKPPEGRVSVNALPWAQVWIDGKSVGETPLANLAVSIGDHEITFRHPELGERTETTTVRADTPTRVSVSFEK